VKKPTKPTFVLKQIFVIQTKFFFEVYLQFHKAGLGLSIELKKLSNKTFAKPFKVREKI
jgi:hypothetical protein